MFDVKLIRLYNRDENSDRSLCMFNIVFFFIFDDGNIISEIKIKWHLTSLGVFSTHFYPWKLVDRVGVYYTQLWTFFFNLFFFCWFTVFSYRLSFKAYWLLGFVYVVFVILLLIVLAFYMCFIVWNYYFFLCIDHLQNTFN